MCDPTISDHTHYLYRIHIYIQPELRHGARGVLTGVEGGREPLKRGWG